MVLWLGGTLLVVDAAFVALFADGEMWHLGAAIFFALLFVAQGIFLAKEMRR